MQDTLLTVRNTLLLDGAPWEEMTRKDNEAIYQFKLQIYYFPYDPKKFFVFQVPVKVGFKRLKGQIYLRMEWYMYVTSGQIQAENLLKTY